jgi:hypothetical protein
MQQENLKDDHSIAALKSMVFALKSNDHPNIDFEFVAHAGIPSHLAPRVQLSLHLRCLRSQ